ncbi:DUF742 domain-containing protein [Nocardiopsis suaedae]|uniref:DUF742 domain-containing protein n=1 Tax=Nocardiopsis suaedae TaxID=3018444 RepID=A0ABT4TVK2_9ACTN|nr:DUF742 domain-containing protein [Nocardiopsis suaedae]MDA2808728.1 DUF742 domain-containing protein [Nocardiopsis suaedae]
MDGREDGGRGTRPDGVPAGVGAVPGTEADGPGAAESGLLDAGPLLRPFALRAGRPPAPASPRPSARTPAGPLTAVRAADPADADGEPYPEVAAVLRACARPCRVVDLAAETGLPLTVARHLVRDLTAEGRLEVCHSRPADDRDILEDVLEGLKAL